MEKTIEIIFTEDKDLLRNAIIRELNGYPVKVIGEACNGKELLKLLVHKHPDVVILDLEMPIMNGNETMNHLMKKFPETKVLILTMHNEHLLVENFMARGARGFIPKDQIAGDIRILLSALKIIRDGGIYIHPQVSEERRFSKRQKDMMPLIFDGKTNEQIAVEIGMSKRSVEKSRQKIYEKADTNKAVGFYKYAFSRGLQFLSRLATKTEVYDE
jgi:DNA-binding NarL/FixJ family response regulator